MRLNAVIIIVILSSQGGFHFQKQFFFLSVQQLKSVQDTSSILYNNLLIKANRKATKQKFIPLPLYFPMHIQHTSSAPYPSN